MVDMEKEIRKEENFFNKIITHKNFWMYTSIVLVIALVLVLVWPNGMSASQAGNALTDYAKLMGVDAVVSNITSGGASLYQITLNIGGSPAVFYVTRDGKYYIPSMYVLELNPPETSKTPAESSDATKDKCSTDAATRMGLDSTKIESLAFSKSGIELLKLEQVADEKYDVTGSPTLIINGVQSDAIYSGTETTKSAICSAFITKPAECNGVPVNVTGITKNAKPVIELFVMSYCPFGVRAETTMAPLQKLFGDKIDLKIRFIVQVTGDTINDVQSLHGITEAKEDARQLAIVQLYPDKYWAYLEEFNNVCYGGGAASSGSCG